MLSKNRNVVGICMLQASLVAAANFTLTAAPTGRALHRAMKRSLEGRVPPQINDAVAAGLDMDDLWPPSAPVRRRPR